MLQENNTKTTNNDERRVVRIPINKIDAEDILRQFNAPFPAIEDLTEIHFVITDEDDAKEGEIE